MSRFEYEFGAPQTKHDYLRNFKLYVPAQQAYSIDLENSQGKADAKGRIPMPLLYEAAKGYHEVYATLSNAVPLDKLVRHYCKGQ
jgi:hypothetical protein